MARINKGKAPHQKTARSSRTRSRVAAAKGKTAKGVAQKKSVKAKSERVVAKLTKPKPAAQRKQLTELPIEVVKVEQINEPVSGVVVVSEVESVQVGPVAVTTVPDGTK